MKSGPADNRLQSIVIEHTVNNMNHKALGGIGTEDVHIHPQSPPSVHTHSVSYIILHA